MPTYELNDLTKWQHLPIDGIVFFYDESTDADKKVTFRNIREQGANWSIVPIKSKGKDSKGNARLIGYKLEGSITILENEIDNYTALLAYMEQDPVDIYINLKGTNSNAGEIDFRFNNLDGFRHFSHTVSIVSSDGKDPQIKIDFQGRVHKTRLVYNPTYSL